jgi:circadian clock protein KaiC
MMRVKTGIAELDEMLHGGLIKGDATLVAGSAGTGKTILGLQFLFNGATRFGENGIYITFEQLPQLIYRDAKSLGWDFRKLEEEKKIKVVCTSPNLLLEGLDKGLLDGLIQDIDAKRIVIDSLSHLQVFVPETEFRKEAYRLINYLKVKGLTSILTQEVHEVVGTSLAITGIGTSFLVDCIILLKFVEIESSMRKALVVLKMRGSDHDKRLRELEVTSTGIKVLSPFEKYEQVMTGTPRKVIPAERLTNW